MTYCYIFCACGENTVWGVSARYRTRCRHKPQNEIRHTLSADFTEPIRRLATAESENGVWKLSAEHPQTETWMIPADR